MPYLSTCDAAVDATVDLGSGTLRAAYRSPTDGLLVTLPVTGGDRTACNTWIEAATKHKLFATPFAKTGFRNCPSYEMVANTLASGKPNWYRVAGVDFRPALLATANPVVNNILNAANEVRGKLRSELQRDLSADPNRRIRVDLIGGGAALLRAVLGAEKTQKFENKYQIDVVSRHPELQTVLSMERLFHQRLVNNVPMAKYADGMPKASVREVAEAR